MKITMTPARAPVCALDAPHTSAQDQFRGATPYGMGRKGISVSRVRTLNVTQDKAMGPAARERPR